MSRHVQAYRQVQAQSWTRVDMLLALYDKSLLAIDAGIVVLSAERTIEVPPARVQVQRLLLGLIDGMDIEKDETSQNLARLLMFSIRKTGTDDVQGWQDARRIVQTLREAFAGVRDEAVQAERLGEIPPIDWRTPVAFSA